MKYALPAIAAVVAFAAPAAAQNVLTNGGFEGQAASYQVVASGDNTTLPGWTATQGGVEWFKPQGYLPGLSGPAKDGASVVDLAWSGNGGGVSQGFNTVAGQVYRLTFWGLTAQAYGRDGTGIIDVSLDSNPLLNANLAYGSGTWGANAWSRFTTTFVGTGGSQVLNFSNNQNENQHFAFLDAVSVTAVPEPAAWALMILGFGLVGGAMRRRATTQGIAAA